MLPGKMIIRACPHCNQLLVEETLASGNTFGATHWSDAKVDAPMLPNYPEFLVCSSCHQSLWIKDASIVNEIPWEDFENPIMKSAKWCDEASIEDYLLALAKPDLNEEREKYLRVRLMWVYNDPYRKDPSLEYQLLPEQKENLVTLKALLNDGKIDSIIMSSEIHRSLGEFDDCIKTLKKLPDGKFEGIVETFTTLSKAKNSKVAVLT